MGEEGIVFYNMYHAYTDPHIKQAVPNDIDVDFE